jgi:hypothetical protein
VRGCSWGLRLQLILCWSGIHSLLRQGSNGAPAGAECAGVIITCQTYCPAHLNDLGARKMNRRHMTFQTFVCFLHLCCMPNARLVSGSESNIRTDFRIPALNTLGQARRLNRFPLHPRRVRPWLLCRLHLFPSPHRSTVQNGIVGFLRPGPSFAFWSLAFLAGPASQGNAGSRRDTAAETSWAWD